jgi:hypothetical protein
MKKILKFLFLLLLGRNGAQASSLIWNGKADTKWYKKSQNEFTITTPEQLAGLAKLVNNEIDFLGKTVKLGANIMLNDTTNWQNWASKPPKNKWKPIGFHKFIDKGHIGPIKSGRLYDEPFRGTFDGNGFVVSGIYVKPDSYVGLFGYTSPSPFYGGVIKNLGVTASYIIGGSFVGGLVGYHKNSPIINCYSTAWVVGGYHVGGLAGESFFGKITDSYSSGIVIGRLRTGGLVGKGSGEISRSYSIGRVTGEKEVGGLVGSGVAIIINNSYSTGSVTGKEKVGGLVGYNYNSTISSSYSSGKITGEKNAGGLVGLNKDEGKTINSYYDKETSSQNDEGKGDGKTTTEMKEMATFKDWDFYKVWSVSDKANKNYPYLRTKLQIQNDSP